MPFQKKQDAIRNQGVMTYLSPQLNQSVRNLATWFDCSINEMFNRLLRLGLENAEFLLEADKKKAEYRHKKAIEFLHVDFNKQKPTNKTDYERGGL